MIDFFSFIAYVVSIFVLYNQYDAIFKLMADEPEFNQTKKYFWKCMIPFYPVWLLFTDTKVYKWVKSKFNK